MLKSGGAPKVVAFDLLGSLGLFCSILKSRLYFSEYATHLYGKTRMVSFGRTKAKTVHRKLVDIANKRRYGAMMAAIELPRV